MSIAYGSSEAMGRRAKRIVVVGAGMGGLAAAVDLASRGFAVTVLERAAAPGGKMREVIVGGQAIDAGPTVLTMRWAFAELFASAGADLADYVTCVPARTLARHGWANGRLDLFADLEETVAAIGEFAGAADARGYRAFCWQAQRIYDILERPFIRSEKPNLAQLMWRVGLHRPVAQWRINPYQTLWDALGKHFRDPRLRQLFARYSTYCGASPFRAPATLMLVAHCERGGVWLVEGGMHRIAKGLAQLATERGAQIRFGAHVARVSLAGGRAAGVELASGERIEADAVVMNADPAAVAGGRFGAEAARGVADVTPARRSMSAVTFAATARTAGFPLVRHTVFFSDAYKQEFEDIHTRGAPPGDPTVYVCAQDRADADAGPPTGEERLLMVVNAPACGDARAFNETEIDLCRQRTLQRLERCGLSVQPSSMEATTPSDFERLFPGTGGALYGRAPHGWMASFQRPGARSRLRGLYFAGGSAHPGPGAPMAALSGRLAAARIAADLGST
ncbi:MAG: phytoene desaturase family protein [Hyphomicrobiales bacterium]|nr:phytoene desaturase family protein [Hyphomicrobiales bacterium]